jgi:hypothetical protein
VISDAPGIPQQPLPPQAVRSRRTAKQFVRANDYSMRMIEKLRSLVGIRDQLTKLRSDGSLSETAQKRLDNVFVAIRRVRKNWRALARQRSSDSEQFILIRLTVLVDGIDKSYERAVKAGKVPLAERVGILSSPPGDFTGLSAGPSGGGHEFKQSASHKWRCTYCQRTSGIRICRLCGRELAPPDRSLSERNNRRGKRKQLPFR